MTIEEKTNYTIMIPAKGYHFSNTDKTEMYEGFICLGKYDVPENYIEVSDSEYKEWKRRKAEEIKVEG